MPSTPARACRDPRCPNRATERGWCPQHAALNPAWAQKRHIPGDVRGTWRWTKKIRPTILARDHHTCLTCGAPATQVDHIVPVTAGGHPTDHSNLQSLCTRCHERKSASDRARWGRGV